MRRCIIYAGLWFICGMLWSSDSQTPLAFDHLIENYLHTKAHHFHNDVAFKQYKQTWRDAVHRGSHLLYHIRAGNPPAYHPTHYDDHIGDIRKIVTFLYAISMHKTETQNGFTAGAILTKDPYKHLFNFLYSSPHKYEAHQATHRNKGPLDTTGYAINVTEESCPSDFIAGKVSVYFSWDNEHNAVHIKPESKPRKTWRDTSVHMLSGIASLWRKNGPGSNDLNEYHKPHVPDDIVNSYRNIIQDHVYTNQQGYHNDEDRISRIITNLHELREMAPCTQKIDELLMTIYARFDYPHIRSGKEMVYGDEISLFAAPSQSEQFNTVKQEYQNLSHALFLYRHPAVNQVYATNYLSKQITLPDVEHRIQQYLTAYDQWEQKDSSGVNSHVSDYAHYVTQKLRTIYHHENWQTRARAIQGAQLLEDPTFTHNSQSAQYDLQLMDE